MEMSEFFKIIGSKHNYFLKERNWSNIDKNLKLLLEICQLFCTNFKLYTWPWEQKSSESKIKYLTVGTEIKWK
jgi:hypothetical protein